MTYTVSNAFSLVVFEQGAYKRVFTHNNRAKVEQVSEDMYADHFSRIVEHADTPEAAKAVIDELNGVETKTEEPTLTKASTPEAITLIEKVVKTLTADLETAKEVLEHKAARKEYVVILNDNYESLLRFDDKHRGNFTGTLSNARRFNYSQALNMVDRVLHEPNNAQYLEEGAVITYIALNKVCERVVAELPQRIEDFKRILNGL
ncbi:hypothetical protein [Vibrio phage vB_VhaS-a]|nr:hypothetical protein [Vibrio phage vB_VhaS-a]